MKEDNKSLVVLCVVLTVWAIATCYSFYECDLKTGIITIKLTRHFRNSHMLIFYEGKEGYRFYPHRFFDDNGEKIWPFYKGHLFQIEYRGNRILSYVDLTTGKTYTPEEGPR